MAIAPNSRTKPSTPCIISCQVSETSETPCAESMAAFAESGGPESCESGAPGSGICTSAMCVEFASSDGYCRLSPAVMVLVSVLREGGGEAEIGGRLIFPCPARLFHGTEGDVRAIGLKFAEAKICRNYCGTGWHEGPTASKDSVCRAFSPSPHIRIPGPHDKVEPTLRQSQTTGYRVCRCYSPLPPRR